MHAYCEQFLEVNFTARWFGFKISLFVFVPRPWLGISVEALY